MLQYMNPKLNNLTADEKRKRNRTFIDPVTEVPRLEEWFVFHDDDDDDDGRKNEVIIIIVIVQVSFEYSSVAQFNSTLYG